VVTLVLIIGLINFALGYFLAVAFAGGLTLSPAMVPEPVVEEPPPDATEVDSARRLPAPPRTLHGACDEVSTEWLRQLHEKAADARSSLTSVLPALRLELGVYRKHMFELEERVRRFHADPRNTVAQQIVLDLVALNEAWLDKHHQAAAQLAACPETSTEFDAVRTALAETFRAQIASLTGINERLAAFHETAVADAGERLMHEVQQLFELAHRLRDRRYESLLALVRLENALEHVDHRFQVDPLTSLANRCGLKVHYYRWSIQARQRNLLLSAVMLDLDSFGGVNARLGTWTGDRLLTGVGRAIQGALRKDRGLDLAGRLAADKFVLFLEETDLAKAAFAAERFRQAIAATTFDCDGHEVRLTVSCGVVEARGDEAADELYERLRIVSREARAAGGNRTYVDGGQGPQPADAPDYEFAPRTISA
jgi:diguanylate cyclase (GGDEF)-like protein